MLLLFWGFFRIIFWPSNYAMLFRLSEHLPIIIILCTTNTIGITQKSVNIFTKASSNWCSGAKADTLQSIHLSTGKCSESCQVRSISQISLTRKFEKIYILFKVEHTTRVWVVGRTKSLRLAVLHVRLTFLEYDEKHQIKYLFYHFPVKFNPTCERTCQPSFVGSYESDLGRGNFEKLN